MTEPNSLPLSGVRIVDFTQVMLGPCATQLLGDFGADVIKIERPQDGDLSRRSIPDPDGHDNPVFISANRNKRSIALDVRSEEGRAIAVSLIAGSDVVVSNFRPGVMERLGLGYEDLLETNPRIIYAVATGFGTSGPHQHKGGQDAIAQAYTGVMARRADPSAPPAVYATAMADYSAGMHLVQGILLALLGRMRTGAGQRVEVSLYDSMLSAQMQEASMLLMRARELNWAAMPLSGVFPTADGAVVLVGAFKANPLREVCIALGLADLSTEPEFSTEEKQLAGRAALQRVLRERFAKETTAYWLGRLEAQDLLCAPVRTLSEALEDPQTAHNGMLVEFEHPISGRVRAVGPPIHLSGMRAQVRRAAPLLGEHTDDILRDLGFAEAQVAGLRSRSVVG
jgi:crotonobetainyl-CoA:carnitine CoA-transferase CaiB-like acyl-CoA transferase